MARLSHHRPRGKAGINSTFTSSDLSGTYSLRAVPEKSDNLGGLQIFLLILYYNVKQIATETSLDHGVIYLANTCDNSSRDAFASGEIVRQEFVLYRLFI